MGYSSVVKDHGRRREGRLTDDTEADLIAEVYNNDVKFRISPRFKKPFVREPNPRGAITRFTNQSRRRLRFLIRNTADMWKVFLTLTYPMAYPASGPETKKHLAAFCAYLRRKKISYIWILEFQKRAAPHYHFILSGYIDKEDVARRWYEIVGSEDPRHLEAGTRIEGVKNPDEVGLYMSSYMSKLDQKAVPRNFHNVGRFWGSTRLLKKTVYRKKGIYKDAAKALRTYRRWFQSHTKQDFSFKWKWKGFGFVLIDGARLFESRRITARVVPDEEIGEGKLRSEGLFLRSLVRQSVMIDEGLDVWEEWDGKPDLRPHFLTHEDKMREAGQFLLDGGIELEYPDLQMPNDRKCWARDRLGLNCEEDSTAVYRFDGTEKELSVCKAHEGEILVEGGWSLVQRWRGTTDGFGKPSSDAPGVDPCRRCVKYDPHDQHALCPGAPHD